MKEMKTKTGFCFVGSVGQVAHHIIAIELALDQNIVKREQNCAVDFAARGDVMDEGRRRQPRQVRGGKRKSGALGRPL
jgi:hypothetical protein